MSNTDILDDPNFLERIIEGSKEDEERHMEADRQDWEVIMERWDTDEDSAKIIAGAKEDEERHKAADRRHRGAIEDCLSGKGNHARN